MISHFHVESRVIFVVCKAKKS